MKPSAIEPKTFTTALAASPFLKGFGHRPRSMGRMVDLASIIRVVLVVLIVNSREARKKGGINGHLFGVGGPSSGGTCVGDESSEGTRTSSG